MDREGALVRPAVEWPNEAGREHVCRLWPDCVPAEEVRSNASVCLFPPTHTFVSKVGEGKISLTELA